MSPTSTKRVQRHREKRAMIVNQVFPKLCEAHPGAITFTRARMSAASW